MTGSMESLFAAHGIAALLKCVLALGHLIGLALGLGTVLFLDGGCAVSIATRSWDRYRAFMSSPLFGFATRLVMIGLAILWITGIGFLVQYAIFSPENLANPKIYAKLTLVTILTVNGGILHHCVLRQVAGMGNVDDFMMSRVGRMGLICGSVSGASWIGAFLLGALPLLNNVVSVSSLLAAWAGLVVVVFFCTRALVALHRRRLPAPGYRTETSELAI